MTTCKHDHKYKSPNDMVTVARRICEEKSRRFTPLRAHIFALIANSTGPVKAYDILNMLEPEVGSQKPPTVYRALRFLSELGLVHRVEALNAYIACDHSEGRHVAVVFYL